LAWFEWHFLIAILLLFKRRIGGHPDLDPKAGQLSSDQILPGEFYRVLCLPGQLADCLTWL
tara:strand:- start:3400 stop:3582 length:183 start_codon:yes stop_codon:yes gene_type:complete